MIRLWSFIFLLIPVWAVLTFAYGPRYGLDFPAVNSRLGQQIDALYYLIFTITGAVFLLTQLFLVYVILRYARTGSAKLTNSATTSTETGLRLVGRRAYYTHGNRTLEIWWTIIPGILLAIIAVAQLPVWMALRVDRPKQAQPEVRVIGRQFEWWMIYPGPDGVFDTIDDVRLHNELHVPLGKRILIDLRSMDVLHDFFVPHLRIKHDALPGKSIPVWFDTIYSTRDYQDRQASLVASDVWDLTRLAQRLSEPERPLEQELAQLLTETTKQALADWLQRAAASDTPIGLLPVGVGEQPQSTLLTPKPTEIALLAQRLRDLLLTDLNPWIQKQTLPAAELWTDVEINPAIQKHRDLPAEQQWPRLMRRQLLQAAFADCVLPLNKHFTIVCAELCGWGHYHMLGKLIVHDRLEEYEAWLAESAQRQEVAE